MATRDTSIEYRGGTSIEKTNKTPLATAPISTIFGSRLNTTESKSLKTSALH